MAHRYELDTAIEAAQRAARLIEVHAGRVHSEDVREKGTHDLVTEIDEQAQSIIIETLLSAFPNDEVLAEEGADLATAERHTDGRRWIIDPIDGTTNFTHGFAPYAVSIALQAGADVVVGVVLDVPRGELFTAVRGSGLRVNGAPAGVSATASLDDALVGTGFPFRAYEHLDAFLAVMRRFMTETRGLRRPGSAAVDLAHVACGRFDAFFETGLHPWDVAAGLLLIEEGGGRVTDLDGQRLPLFAHGMVASNGALHEVVMEYVEELRISHANAS